MLVNVFITRTLSFIFFKAKIKGIKHIMPSSSWRRGLCVRNSIYRELRPYDGDGLTKYCLPRFCFIIIECAERCLTNDSE